MEISELFVNTINLRTWAYHDGFLFNFYQPPTTNTVHPPFQKALLILTKAHVGVVVGVDEKAVAEV